RPVRDPAHRFPQGRDAADRAHGGEVPGGRRLRLAGVVPNRAGLLRGDDHDLHPGWKLALQPPHGSSSRYAGARLRCLLEGDRGKPPAPGAGRRMSPVWKGIPRLRGSRPAPAVLATLLLLGLLAPDSARAKRIFVPRQHQHLQAAIDAAEVGDTIWVSAGTYYGPFILKKRLLLFGDGGPAETVLDGRDSVRVLHVEGVARGGIYGFRIQRGKAPGGGGIYCLHDTAFAIGSCDIRSNWEAGVSAWQCALIQIS